ncbi:MAG: response regulator transcription factor [Lachnospiraceae bacterium]|nr:response regulator transcription factor [Lachnospiraceae bacterium]
MKKILIADDNEDIIDVLSNYIVREGYEPVVAKDGEQALELFEKEQPAMALIDIMMPKIDGYEVCRSIRKKSSMPIILVTARGEDFERVMGLDIGADDYVVKPFSPNEVMARVRAVLRRVPEGKVQTSSSSEQILSLSNLVVNMEEYTASINGNKIALTKKEIETMWILGQNPNKVFTRDNLLDSLWGFDYFGDSRTVDSHIKRLRSKIDKEEHPQWRIKTIWGVGYKFEVDEEEE